MRVPSLLLLPLLLALHASTAQATGSPSYSTLLGWSEDGRHFATLERYEDAEVEIQVHRRLKRAGSKLVLRIATACYPADWPKVACHTLAKTDPQGDYSDNLKRFRRVGPRHKLLRKFDLLAVRPLWREQYAEQSLRFERAGIKRFKKRGPETSWRLRDAQRKVIGYIRRGDDIDEPTVIVGGYLQPNTSFVLVKLRDLNDGYRSEEYYLPVDISLVDGRSLN